MTKPLPNNSSEGDSSSTKGCLTLGWLLLGLVPIPIGLLAGPLRLFDDASQGRHRSSILFALVTFAITLTAGNLFSHTPVLKGVKAILVGIFIGIMMGVLDLSVIWFTGCCSAISNTH
jgi:hypothetical protein